MDNILKYFFFLSVKKLFFVLKTRLYPFHAFLYAHFLLLPRIEISQRYAVPSARLPLHTSAVHSRME